MKALVTVRLKNGVLDPQGLAIQKSLKALGFSQVVSVRQGKVFEIELVATGRDEAQKELNAMAEKLLANTVIEEFEVNLK